MIIARSTTPLYSQDGDKMTRGLFASTITHVTRRSFNFNRNYYIFKYPIILFDVLAVEDVVRVTSVDNNQANCYATGSLLQLNDDD
jgi:hypothetical protein